MASPQPEQPPGRPSLADLTGRQLGRYEVLLLLASGGMATVYIARRGGVAGFERLVAIKVLHPHLAHDEEFISMFLDEARLAARIRHPNVVATLDISDTQGDGYFLVMDYVEGDHLGHLLRAAGKLGERLPVPVVSRIVMDALSGLDAAHNLFDAGQKRLDLVHRDLSPHNLLVGADGIARITDFGVAKAQVRLSSTRDGQFKGKLSYMAPEQAASGEADQRSDLFSMGIVLWEALTGRRLFRGENNADVLNKILNPKVPKPSQLDAALAPFDAVAERALAREPEDRFQTAEEFFEAVETAAASCGGVATPRAVGREVKRLLGDKIDRENVSIRDAIDALGRNELLPGVLPRPIESGSQPTFPSAVHKVSSDDETLGAKPSTVLHPTNPPPPKRTAFVAVAALICVFTLGGAFAAWMLLGREGAPPVDVEDTSSAPVEPPDEPVVATPPPVEPPSTPETTSETTAGATGEGDTDQDPTQTPRNGRRRPRQGGASQSDPPTSPEPPDTGGGDDELMLNPYRR